MSRISDEQLNETICVTGRGWAYHDYVLDLRDARATIADLRQKLERAREALDQLLDDMGEDGLCVCPAAKNQAARVYADLSDDPVI